MANRYMLATLLYLVSLNVSSNNAMEPSYLIHLETSPRGTVSQKPRLLSGELLQVSDCYISLMVDSTQYVLDRARVHFIEFDHQHWQKAGSSVPSHTELDVIETKTGQKILCTILDLTPTRLQYILPAHEKRRQELPVSELSWASLSNSSIQFTF